MSTSLQPSHEQVPPDGSGSESGSGSDATASATPAVADASAPPFASLLDNPVWTALSGPHRHLAETEGSAARYPEAVSPFAALADCDDPRQWTDLATLIGPGNAFALASVPKLPEGWDIGQSGTGVQLVADSLRGEADEEAVRLGASDVPEMLDLVGRTKPGPFMPRTIELGAYYGIRREGVLAAMAGERLRVPGGTEISAVCTDERYRGQGLASRLIRHTAAGIQERGETPFLHAAAVNTGAIRLYESLGFSLRRTVVFHFLRVPEHALTGR
ncbi:GNAT family N-acetyltransferase [Streptomyces sp. NBC_01190]|uniref:GNAT family N-acetyltransferase n=1 Tax=Streptomyces sp. NBC_01190 TaxID=2903767 RepID=UPI003863CFD4|nr:GNAT family N-acetyltransferase [Streptomyces sp. NBC_01190]